MNNNEYLELQGTLQQDDTLDGQLQTTGSLTGQLSTPSVITTNDYDKLINRPHINSILLEGDKTSAQLKLQDKMDVLTPQEIERILYLDQKGKYMADKFINETGLLTIKQWIEGKFALDSDVDELAAEVQELITEGGEPNVIETVKVNGIALTPDANKAVDVVVVTEEDIETIFNDIATDYEFQSAEDVQRAIDSALTSAMTYKGDVATVADLPATGNKVGDFYNVTATGQNFAWNGNAWDDCGALVDTSVLWTSTAGQSNTLVAMTVAEINAILNPSS